MTNNKQDFEITPSRKINRPKFEWTDESRQKAKRLPYPTSTIMQLLYTRYNYDFVGEKEFHDLLRVTIEAGNVYALTLKNNDKILDKDDKITLQASGKTKDEHLEIMLKLAEAKGWDCINFSGSDEFLKLAWKKATEKNMEIGLKPGQEELFKQFQQDNNLVAEPKQEVEQTPKPKGLKL